MLLIYNTLKVPTSEIEWARVPLDPSLGLVLSLTLLLEVWKIIQFKSNTLYIRTAILVILIVMVFNATFNNISIILWWSVLLFEETTVPWENHRPATSHWQTLSHNVVLSTPHLSGIRTHKVSGDRHRLHR